MSRQKFMSDLLKGTEFKIVNGTGLLGLSNNRVAKLVITTKGTHGQYEGLKLSVINKQDGVVDSQFFNFSEYLECEQNPSAKKFRVIEHCGWDWYQNKPSLKSVESFRKNIMEYLSFLA